MALWLWLALAAVAVMLDAVTTSLGLARGLAERGPLASTLLCYLGPLYWPVELALVYVSIRLASRLLARASGLGEAELAEAGLKASILVLLLASWVNALLVLGAGG